MAPPAPAPLFFFYNNFHCYTVGRYCAASVYFSSLIPGTRPENEYRVRDILLQFAPGV